MEFASADEKPKTLSYGDGVREAEKTGKPLVTAVGREPVAVAGAVCARTGELQGFNADTFVVSMWIDGDHVGYPVTKSADIAPTIVKLRGERAVKTASIVCFGGVCHQR